MAKDGVHEMLSSSCSISFENEEGSQSDEKDINPALVNSAMWCCSSTTKLQASQELLVPSFKQCRICLVSDDDSRMDDGSGFAENDDSEKMILSPCNCKGTYVHERCLRRWLDIRQSDIPANQCELCLSSFATERRCRPLTKIACVRMRRSDCVLHSIFVVFLGVVVLGITATFWCFHSGPIRTQFEVFNTNKKLSFHEILTLIFGTVSFVAFFISLVAQICVKESFLMLIRRFVRENREERFVDRTPELWL